MRIKTLIRFNLQMLVIMGLFFANIPSALAQDGTSGEAYIGQVSASTSRSLPAPKSILNFILPLANQPLPSGGTAIATAELAWTSSRMDGIAKSSLSADTVGTYSICAEVKKLFMNSSDQGGAAMVCAAKTGGGSVKSTKSKVVFSVYGKSWRVDTAHLFSKPGWQWFTTLSVSKNL